jgi:uncharacterized lipoprotein YbaY
MKALKWVAMTVLIGMLAADAAAQTIAGTATYRERMNLPKGAMFEATIEDVSRADAPASVIATTSLSSPGNPPIAFTIAYDRSKIVERGRYVVRARILLDGKLLFTSDVATPVITGGHPSKVSIMLRRSGADAGSAGAPSAGTSPPTSSSPLQGTMWQLVKFQGGDGTTLTPDDRTKYALDFGSDGSVTAQIDCNRGRGTWRTTGSSQLQLGPLALTRVKCAEGSLHDQIVKQWPFIRSFLIKEGHLFLVLMADGGTYEFEPRGTKK